MTLPRKQAHAERPTALSICDLCGNEGDCLPLTIFRVEQLVCEQCLNVDNDGQPDERQEWRYFDPEC